MTSFIEPSGKIAATAENTMTLLPLVVAEVSESPMKAVKSFVSRPPTTDEDLMAAIATGDSDAFAELVRRHHRRVRRLALLMAGSPSDGEDIAQEAFIRVWSSASRWRPVDRGWRNPIKTWFYRVILNLAIDRKRQRVVAPIENLYDVVDGSDDGFAHLYRHQISNLVSSAIARLPERQRAALTLCFFQGHSNHEAGKIMSSTVSAVESLLIRARRVLRENLGNVYRELSEK
jgi:RNA polymerase sigma-70 factor, ECF subfamily